MLSMRHVKAGFTIVEVAVIAPIVILAIGAIIAAIVVLTGDTLANQAEARLADGTQTALAIIDQDIQRAGGFLAAQAVPTSQRYRPDGPNHLASTGVAGSGQMLLLNSLVTDREPSVADRRLIYTQHPTGSCADTIITANTPWRYTLAYFVKDNRLVRRAIMRLNGDGQPTEPICHQPWQLPTCDKAQVDNRTCRAEDTIVADNITAIKVEYFTSARSGSPLPTADTANPTDRQTALDTTDTVRVSVTSGQQVAGRSVEFTGAVRSTRLYTLNSD